MFLKDGVFLFFSCYSEFFTGLCWREGEAAEPATAVEECLRGAEIRASLLRFSLAALRQANGQCCRVWQPKDPDTMRPKTICGSASFFY
jgi:hypothetical protein